ncbi:efflux RND transporter periplasmic adaptor subunit [Herbaspirillum sp. alder98]|uniref:efflux RND transporter periplasmic adaptor subunit n=1 Tax=Herbaspirillum sp. alder98 TaxID=2913096 RepID=UPI001CD83699|nr:efflux RND transporter periplasmic adaptor subunit [Herbaspirillum sp. alder98]MCA1326339.1 efflux RND transporter periplasmic adaptor subunit [Herbaspirillum sp. alder98]
MKHAFHLRSRSLPARALLTLPLFVVLAACSKPEPVADAPREVVVLQAQQRNGAQALRLPAEVQSRFVTAMSFRVAGKLSERRVHLGDKVKKGQLLARLDPVDADYNAASARADLDSARQHLDAAGKQLKRDTDQARENLISAQQLEQSQDAHAAALAQFKAAEARAGVAGNQRNYTDLVADRDGVISAEQANTGDVLAAGQAVYSLAWSGAVDVITDAAEGQVARIKSGAPATVTLAALPGRSFNGRVREVSPAADAQSRTYRVKVTLEQPDAAVLLGMSGEVLIANQDQSAAPITVLPATALFHQGEKPALWIVGKDGKLELRPVTVAAYGERSISLSQGVAVGEQVVVQGVHTLTAGEKVKAIAPLHAEDFAL